MNKNMMIVVAVILVVVAFVGGAFAGPKIPLLSSVTGASASAQSGRGFGGPMANLSDAERQKLQNMSDTERRAYFQQKFGGQMPGGANSQSGSGQAGGGFRGGPRTLTIEGTINDVASDSLTIATTNGGSSTVYYDTKTTVAYAKGATQAAFAKGMKVIAIATPETDQVISATAILVK